VTWPGGTESGQALAGVVLAGGRSTRLGRDKARILLGGKDLLARTAHLLLSITPEVWVMGRDPREHGLDLPWRLDDIPGKGPLGGIITALRVLRRPCLVLSCDLPFIARENLLPLLAARATARTTARATARATGHTAAQPDNRAGNRAENRAPVLMTTYSQVGSEYIQALVAIYEPEALPVLEAAAAAGEHKLSRIVPRELRCHVAYTQDQALPFFNINYPADLALMRKLEASTVGQAVGLGA